ncbi:MAG: hypothetical protein ACRDZ1_04400 [Acidimicrobiia bacterium]
MRGIDLRVPEEVADAVRAEANRRLCRPGEVLVDFLRRYWPRYVAEDLRRDLTTSVIDVRGTERWQATQGLVGSDATSRPALPEPGPEREGR